MTGPDRCASRLLLPAQLAVVAGAALALAAPPAQGVMLLLPLGRDAGRGLAAEAVRRDAALIGSGPVAGSLVVRGERARLWSAMLRAGVLVLAAPPAGCRGAEARA